MDNYRGKFTIIVPDGTEVELTGTLAKTFRNGLQSWAGKAAGVPSMARSLPAQAATLRLPNGSEADVLITDVSSSIDHRGEVLAVSLLGNGSAPF